MSGEVNPAHYQAGAIETITKIEMIVDGLCARNAYLLGNIIKYACRAGLKGSPEDAMTDLQKANNYAHRLCTGEWRTESKDEN